MLKIELKSTAGRDLQQITDELRNGLDDVLTGIGMELAGFVSEDFERKSRGGTGEDGIKWAPLAESTIKKKAKRAKGGDTSTQIGVDTGLMRSTIQPGFKPSGSDGGGVQVKGHEVEVAFGRRYAKFFDEGRPAKTRTKQKPLEEIKKLIADNDGTLKGIPSSKLTNQVTSGGQPARTLIPEKLPREWEEAAEEIVQGWIEDLWNSKFGK